MILKNDKLIYCIKMIFNGLTVAFLSPYKKDMNILVVYKNHRSDRYVFCKVTW